VTYCEYCGEQITYLPFTCKYCGGTFCKKHRLPENHECTFELKHVPVVPTTQREPRQQQQAPMKRATSKVYLDQDSKSLRKYLKRQDKQNERTLRMYQKPYKKPSQYMGTKILFITIIIFSIAGLFFNEISEYFYLSLSGLIYQFTYHTVFTSLFASSGDPISLLFLILMLFILYFMARNIEAGQGTNFLIKLYLISCLFTALFYVILRLSLITIYPLTVRIPVGLAWGGILGLLSYSLFPIMNRKITAFMYFLPIRMSGRSFLFIIIIFRLFPVILFVWYAPYYVIFYLPELGGILGAYIVFKYQFTIK
jgi:membrane associated rhomboid family serine protease